VLILNQNKVNRNMKRINFILIFLAAYFAVNSQTSKPKVELTSILKNGIEYVEVSILNSTDSVLYLLHSCFFKDDDSVHRFVEYGRDESLSYYSLRFMNDDIRYDFGIGCFRSTVILPNQTLKFKSEINVEGFKKFEFLVDYFYSDEYNHKEFKKEVLLSGWHGKYEWKELRILTAGATPEDHK
jgi:hypothetical protein